MTEAKIRTQWIEYAAQGRTGMDGQMVREFGHLQLRMICELVALGCLVAHGDIEATKTSRFRSSFSADEILKGLEGLNPAFFPSPWVEVPTGPGLHHFEGRSAADYTTKDELLTLYGRTCGTILHKGSLKNLMKPQPPVQKNFPELMVPAQRLMNLLSVHRISLDENATQFMCWLTYAPNGGRVHVAIAERR
jgi:hypothetical protein